MKVSIGLILSLFMAVLVITSAGCILEKKTSAQNYLDEYSVTPVKEYYGSFQDGDKLYIRYKIAEVNDAALSVFHSFQNDGATKEFSLVSIEEWSSLTKESFKKTMHDVVDYSVGVSASAFVAIPICSILEVGVEAGVYGEYQHRMETTTEWSIQKTVSSAKTKAVSSTIDVTEYAVDDLLYRYVLKGDYDVIQTLVYDLDNQCFDTSTVIVDCVVVGDPYFKMESCEVSTNFDIPESYSRSVSVLTKVDLSDILSGTGTLDNPYKISSEEECLLVLIEPWSFYRLTADIDMDDFSEYFKPEDAKRIDLAGYNLYKLGSEYNPYLIASETDFLKIYDDLSAYYELTSDIVVTELIHSENTVFTGSLDGNGNTIRCISEEAISIGPDKYSSKRYFGLFSENKGTVKNLVLENFVVRGGKQDGGAWIYVGSIAGQNSGTISNVKIIDGTVSIMRAGAAVGMVAGINNAGATIENCVVDGGYVYSRGNGGGVVGYNYGKIVSVRVIGNGIDGGSVDDLRFLHHRNKCAGSGDNTGEGRSWGGIVGIAYAGSEMWDVSIRDVYMDINIEGVTGTCYFGWIVGKNRGYIADPTSVENVKYRYDTNILGEVIKGTHQKFKGDKKAYGVNDGGDIPASW